MDSEIEYILGSKGKIKILRVIYGSGEANITRIVRETSLNHRSVVKHLKELVEKGIVEERVLGRVKLYSINFSNPKTLLLREIFTSFEY